jgi:glycopeptide antibiotics resistance protein
MRPELLARPNREGLRDTTDILLNILGFVPFGALLFGYLSNLGWKGPLAGLGVVVTGFSISFTIEVLQVLLPSRHSSLLDLINNSIGTALGAWVGFLILSRSAKAGRLRARPLR